MDAAQSEAGVPGSERLVSILLYNAKGRPAIFRPTARAGTLLFHLLLAVVLLGPPFTALRKSEDKDKPADPPRKRSIVKLYLPPQGRPRTEATAHLANSPQLALPQPPPATAPVRKVNMAAIQLSIADDVTGALPEVVRQQGGQLALVEGGYAQYIFDPPDWTMREGLTDISGKVQFSMTPASRWPLLRELAERHGLDLNRFTVKALFEGDYSTTCVGSAIARHAEANHVEGDVRSALLRFTSGQPCGIDVLNVSSNTLDAKTP